jgi:glyoxylase-like metal-dependent hydrolase (beta-lactamase superfamily II)
MLEADRVAPDVVQVAMTTRTSRMAGYGVRAYVSRGVLIDTGFPAVRSDFRRWLQANRPRGVILTHHHEDHSGNVDRVLALGLPISAPAATIAALAQPIPMGLYRQLIWGRPAGTYDPTALAAHTFSDPAFELIPTPGHSHDHHIVWDAERETVFGGDLFLGVKVRLARPVEDPRTLVDSLRRTIALRPRQLFDAHRGPIADPVTSLGAKLQWLEDTIGAIDRRRAQGWSVRAITRDVLGREGGTYYVSASDLSYINFVRTVIWGDKRMTPEKFTE